MNWRLTALFIGFLSFHPLAADAPKYPPVPDSITTNTGKSYTGCKLLKVDPDGVEISHKLGVAKIGFNIMPVEFGKAYGYDAAAALKARQAQAAMCTSPCNQLSARPTAPVMAATITYAPAGSTTRTKLSAYEIATLRSQIQYLEEDIVFMQNQEAKLTPDRRYLVTDGIRVTNGAYQDKILQEQQQVEALGRQLADGS